MVQDTVDIAICARPVVSHPFDPIALHHALIPIAIVARMIDLVIRLPAIRLTLPLSTTIPPRPPGQPIRYVRSRTAPLPSFVWDKLVLAPVKLHHGCLGVCGFASRIKGHVVVDGRNDRSISREDARDIRVARKSGGKAAAV